MQIYLFYIHIFQYANPYLYDYQIFMRSSLFILKNDAVHSVHNHNVSVEVKFADLQIF